MRRSMGTDNRVSSRAVRMQSTLPDQGGKMSGASMIAGIARASSGTDRGQSTVNTGSRDRHFPARRRAMSLRAPMAAGAGPAMVAIATVAGAMRTSAAMARIRRLCGHRTSFKRHRLLKHHPLFKHPGVARRMRIRRIGEEISRCRRVSSRHLSGTTNAGWRTPGRCRRANACGISRRLAKFFRIRESMDIRPSIARAQTCSGTGRRHRCNPRNAFHRLPACRSKGRLRNPSVQCRRHAVFRRRRASSNVR